MWDKGSIGQILPSIDKFGKLYAIKCTPGPVKYAQMYTYIQTNMQGDTAMLITVWHIMFMQHQHYILLSNTLDLCTFKWNIYFFIHSKSILKWYSRLPLTDESFSFMTWWVKAKRQVKRMLLVSVNAASILSKKWKWTPTRIATKLVWLEMNFKVEQVWCVPAPIQGDCNLLVHHRKPPPAHLPPSITPERPSCAATLTPTEPMNTVTDVTSEGE